MGPLATSSTYVKSRQFLPSSMKCMKLEKEWHTVAVFFTESTRRGGALAGLARTTGLEATSHGFNVTEWSRHAPTPPATGLRIVLDTYNTFYIREKGGTGRGGGEGRGKGEDRRAGYMNAAGDGLKPTHPVRRSEIDPGSGLPNEERPLAFPPLSAHLSPSLTIPFLYPSPSSLSLSVLLFRLPSTLTILPLYA